MFLTTETAGFPLRQIFLCKLRFRAYKLRLCAEKVDRLEKIWYDTSGGIIWKKLQMQLPLIAWIGAL